MIIPDITDLYFETPEIIFGNRTCSFKDILQEFKWGEYTLLHYCCALNIDFIPTELISKTGNVLLTSGGLKSFNFTGIKDRFRPGKKQIPSSRPQVTQKQLENIRDLKEQVESRSDTLVSSSAESTTQSDSPTTGFQSSGSNGRMSTDTLLSKKFSSSRRLGSMDLGGRGDGENGEHPEIGTPRRRLMTLLHRTNTSSPRSSPSLVSIPF